MRLARCALLFLFVAGCGPKLHQVTGRVHYADGKPLDIGRVVIDTGNQPTGSWGGLHPDGTFRMGTNSPTDGMPPGTYRVFIDGAQSLPEPGRPVRPLIHPRYSRPETSGLSFTVPEQMEWDITVDRP